MLFQFSMVQVSQHMQSCNLTPGCWDLELFFGCFFSGHKVEMLPVMTMVNATDLPEFSWEPMLKTDSWVLPLQIRVNLVTIHPQLSSFLAYLVFPGLCKEEMAMGWAGNLLHCLGQVWNISLGWMILGLPGGGGGAVQQCIVMNMQRVGAELRLDLNYGILKLPGALLCNLNVLLM